MVNGLTLALLILLLIAVLYAVHLRGVIRETNWSNARLTRALAHVEGKLEKLQSPPPQIDRIGERTWRPDERSLLEGLARRAAADLPEPHEDDGLWDALNGRR